MAEDYRPTRDYHARNDPTVWPDDSRGLGRLAAIRAFWTHGEQMWDQDTNNNTRWFARYLNDTVFWRLEPRYPYYSPNYQRYINDPKWRAAPPADEIAQRMIDRSVFYPTVNVQPVTGVTVYSRADRIVSGYAKNAADHVEWRGWNVREESYDGMEIAFHMSDVRKGRVCACHVVSQPFRLNSGTYSSRFRGWNYRWAGLHVLKNGIKVGTMIKSANSSKLAMISTTDFATGDRLELYSPSVLNVPYSAKSVAVSIYAEIL